jgi:glycosyltransferase involved in cell wall biosynthesis
VTKISLGVFNTQPPHLYFGGVERRIIETARRLLDDIDTTVYSGTKAGFKKPTSVKGVKIFPCFSTDVLFPVDNWFFNRTLASTIERINADIYEVHTVSGYGLLKALRKKHVKKLVIHTIHGVLADEYAQSLRASSTTLRSRFANLMMKQMATTEKETAENADLIVTVSEYSSKKTVEFYDIDPAKIRIAPNGVDTQRFKPMGDLKNIRRQIGIENRLCVLFVGRLIPRKGLSYLFEAAKHVVKKIDNTVFLIVGEGPLRKYLVNYVNKTNLSEKFIFLGDVSEDQLPLIYNCADVFALPSIQEGQGIALLEAQSTAKPVVAFRVGGVPEAMLDGQSGILTKPDSYEFSQSLLRLLSNSFVREEMGHKGREFVVKNFSWDYCAQRMLRVYKEAMSLTK